MITKVQKEVLNNKICAHLNEHANCINIIIKKIDDFMKEDL